MSNDSETASEPDEENPEWSAEEVQQAQPALQVIEQVLGASIADSIRRGPGRPKQTIKKINQTLRLDPDVLAAYKRLGSGWQVKINNVLREHMPRV